MKTRVMNTNGSETSATKTNAMKTRAIYLKTIILATLFILMGNFTASAHCDSFDGPTVKDALKALETNNVNLVLKWITKDQESEIISLFNKTYSLRDGDKEVYSIVETHFLETLVRLHRETEGAPYTGLKPAGTTKPIIQLSDQALVDHDIDGLLVKLNNHVDKVLRAKYDRVAELSKVKDDSPDKGREYVEAYVDYTHTLEAIHDIADQGSGHSAHKHD